MPPVLAVLTFHSLSCLFARWFFGKISLNKAEELLKMPSNSDGSFLIRTTETCNGWYCLSILHRERVQHYLISRSDTGYLFLTSKVAFPTLKELVSYYKLQAHGLCCRLARPCLHTEQLQRSHAYADIDINGQEINHTDLEIDRQLREVNHTDLEINRQEIALVKVYEDGEFTVSWEALWKNTTPVVVEIPKLNKISSTEFLKAIDTIKRLQHPKIIHLHATCTREHPFFAVTEHSMHGNLLHFLRNHEHYEHHLGLSDLIDIAVQVAEGMAYIERRNCTHRHLMAKNVLVGNQLDCKLSGFIATCPTGKDVNEAALKWLAPEVALQSMYSIKSDVWSFGVVLYEINTYGCIPYPELSNTEMVALFQRGQHMACPTTCDPRLYKIMLHCWREKPEDRWTFETLARQLSDFFTIEETDCY